MEERVVDKNSEVEINLKRVGSLLLSKAWLIGLVAVVCAVLTLVGTWLFVAPKYQSTVMFYVNNRVNPNGDSITSSDMSAARGLVQSYAIILNARETLTEVADFADLDFTAGQLQGMIKAEGIDDTEILKVTVTGTDPVKVAAIADAITHVLPERSKQIIDGSSVKIVTGANLPTSPSSPSYPTNAILGFLVGMLAVVAVIVLRDIFDTTIREEEDVTRAGDHPILAAVPDMTAPSKGGAYGRKVMDKTKLADNANAETVGPNISFVASEAYKLLRTKLLLSFADDRKCRVLGVTSTLAGEGKSLTAVNLAYSMSQLGKRVLLIDCDMRKPTMADKLPIQKAPGLSDYLSGQTRAETLIQLCGIAEDESAFHVISAGHTPPNPMELLSSKKMEKTIEQLRENYDYIILDFPPLGEVGDALAAASLTDGMLLVVRRDYCDRISLGETLRQFAFANCKVLGVVFNCAEEKNNQENYYYRRSGRSYAYANAARKRASANGTVSK